MSKYQGGWYWRNYCTLTCDNCGCDLVHEQTYIPLNYCPKCGKRMRPPKHDYDEQQGENK